MATASPGALPSLLGRSMFRLGDSHTAAGVPRLPVTVLAVAARRLLPARHPAAGAERAEARVRGGSDLLFGDFQRMVAGRSVTIAIFGQGWLDLRADLRRVRTAGVETTTAWRIDRVGRVAAQDRSLARSVLIGVRNRNRCQKGLRVRVDRLVVELLC